MGLLLPNERHRRRHGQAHLSAAGLAPPLRLATEADAAVLALLADAASHGLALHVWRELAGPEGDPWAVGAARQAARARAGDYVVVDEGAGAVACLLAAVPEPPDTALDDLPAPFRPLAALEQQAQGLLYVNILATLPEMRGRGHGTRLMRHAEQMARAGGWQGTSLIVADDNLGAQRLYDALGYRERARMPIVGDGWSDRGGIWRLLVRPLD